MTAFDYQPRTRLVFGEGCVAQLGALARWLGGRRVLLVTDPGLVAAGHADRARDILLDAGLEIVLFDQVRENPTTGCVDRCLEIAREGQVDLLVGLGGGSAMDTAKGCNLLLTNGGRIHDYWGVGKAGKPMLPFIAIPTTAGTGSECQSAALIADEQTHQKMACLDPKAAARVALLDPALTVSQPPAVTAHTGIDALTHSVETAVTRKRNPLSRMFSHEAFRLLVPALPRVLQDPHDLEARGQMLLGAAYAGLAIENSMLGAAHAAANPLTAQLDVTHGEAVGIMLPAVVRFNAHDPGCRLAYAELASTPEIACVSEGLELAVNALCARLESLLNQAGIARSLAAIGADVHLIPTLAEAAARQWTANFNPRPVTAADFARLYAEAFEPRGDGA
ncbi:MAG: iron-containing alcohol dehydrogenase [Verrucomicrobia bacterium]|nr:iron-containing alcohol dehydrogenase [Verrucomicrobiota bacterium]